MIFILKLLLGGLAGGALVGTPILVTQLQKSTQPSSLNSKFQYKDSRGEKIECHGTRNFGLKVGEQTVLWAAMRNSVEEANREKHGNKGTIFDGDKSSCDLVE